MTSLKKLGRRVSENAAVELEPSRYRYLKWQIRKCTSMALGQDLKNPGLESWQRITNAKAASETFVNLLRGEDLRNNLALNLMRVDKPEHHTNTTNNYLLQGGVYDPKKDPFLLAMMGEEPPRDVIDAPSPEEEDGDSSSLSEKVS